MKSKEFKVGSIIKHISTSEKLGRDYLGVVTKNNPFDEEYINIKVIWFEHYINGKTEPFSGLKHLCEVVDDENTKLWRILFE